MKIVITGACGGVGSFVLERLANKHELVLIDNCCPDNSQTKLGDFRQVDLINAQKTIDSIDDDTDVVIHLAAIADVKDIFNKPHHSESINVRGTINVLEAVRKSKAGF